MCKIKYKFSQYEYKFIANIIILIFIFQNIKAKGEPPGLSPSLTWSHVVTQLILHIEQKIKLKIDMFTLILV